MPPRANMVNLDAMLSRADFAAEEGDEAHFETIQSVSVRDFTKGALVGPNLRKPDFQRETNHWSPDQIATLLECYVNGELIPSVILWKSPSSPLKKSAIQKKVIASSYRPFLDWLK